MEKKEDYFIWSIVHFNDLSTLCLFDILKLRTEIFVVEQDCPYQEVDDKDKKAFHVFAYSEKGEMAAVARILPEGISYNEVSLGRVAIKEKYRGYGLAHEMTKKMISFISSRFSTDLIRISAQSHLVSFYNKHGFINVGGEYLEDGIPHHEMLRSSN